MPPTTLSRFDRVKYALFATPVGMGIIFLALLLVDSERLDTMFSPPISVCIFVVAYVFAPALEARFPLSRTRKP